MIKMKITIALYYIMCWAGSKLFSMVDVYTPEEKVEAITFGNNREYMKAISKIEVEAAQED